MGQWRNLGFFFPLVFVLTAACAQDRAAFERKAGFQANLSAQIYQAGINIETVKSECQGIIPTNAPVLKTNYETEALDVIRRTVAEPLILESLKQTRPNLSRAASVDALKIPGLSSKSDWCAAGVYVHVALYTSLTKVLSRSAAL